MKILSKLLKQMFQLKLRQLALRANNSDCAPTNSLLSFCEGPDTPQWADGQEKLGFPLSWNEFELSVLRSCPSLCVCSRPPVSYSVSIVTFCHSDISLSFLHAGVLNIGGFCCVLGIEASTGDLTFTPPDRRRAVAILFFFFFLNL